METARSPVPAPAEAPDKSHTAGQKRRARARSGLRFATACGLLVLSALPISPRNVGEVEAALFHGINGLAAWLEPPVWVVMQMGNLLFVPFAATIALLVQRVRLSVELLASGITAYFLATLIKAQVSRGRPGTILGDVILRDAPAGGHGYVSGHAAVAVALATVATPYLHTKGRVLVWAAAAVVCLGRVYVGAHLPLDVVGGAALGGAIGSFVHLLLGPHPAMKRVPAD